MFALDREDVSGPVNLVGPAPVRNADFTRALAHALHRPAVFPVPRFALRIMLGEFANESVASLRVLPGVLGQRGFTFAHPDLPSALRAALHQG
jgi:NAD dependent epimerase/dehydratase family enzyme